MNDPRYQYERVNVIKVIVQNPEGKVLLIQEPETNEWMPLHWGLPGGKPLAKESLYKAFKRKMQEELGQDIEPEGIFRIEELLVEGRTVLMFHAVAKVGEQDIEPEGIFRIEELLVEGRTVLMFHAVAKVGEISLSGESKSYKWTDSNDIEKMDVSEFTEYFNKKLLLAYLTGDKKLVGFDLIEAQNYYDSEDEPEYKRWFESGESHAK